MTPQVAQGALGHRVSRRRTMTCTAAGLDRTSALAPCRGRRTGVSGRARRRLHAARGRVRHARGRRRTDHRRAVRAESTDTGQRDTARQGAATRRSVGGAQSRRSAGRRVAAMSERVAVIRVAVTRAAAQADDLAQRLQAVGFVPVAVPVIDIADAADGGLALRARGDTAGPTGPLRLGDPDIGERCRTIAGGRAATLAGQGGCDRLGDGGTSGRTAGRRSRWCRRASWQSRWSNRSRPGRGAVLLPRAAVARDVLARRPARQRLDGRRRRGVPHRRPRRRRAAAARDRLVWRRDLHVAVDRPQLRRAARPRCPAPHRCLHRPCHRGRVPAPRHRGACRSGGAHGGRVSSTRSLRTKMPCRRRRRRPPSIHDRRVRLRLRRAHRRHRVVRIHLDCRAIRALRADLRGRALPTVRRHGVADRVDARAHRRRRRAPRRRRNSTPTVACARDELLHATGVLPGVVELLDLAHAHGMALAVASSSTRDWVEPHLERLGLRDRFAAVLTREDVAQAKPAPDLFAAAARALDVAAGRDDRVRRLVQRLHRGEGRRA